MTPCPEKWRRKLQDAAASVITGKLRGFYQREPCEPQMKSPFGHGPDPIRAETATLCLATVAVLLHPIHTNTNIHLAGTLGMIFAAVPVAYLASYALFPVVILPQC